MLPNAKKLAGASKFHIFLGKQEAITAAAHDLEPFQCLGLIRTGKQHTIRLTRSTTDTASELVHLGQSKTIRPFNDHQRRIGYIDANFNHRCSNEDLGLSTHKISHDRILFLCFEASVKEAAGNTLQKSLGQFLI